MLDERSRSIELPGSLRSLFPLWHSVPLSLLLSLLLENRESTLLLHLALAHRLTSNPPTDRPTDHWTDRWMDGPTNGGANPRLAKWRNCAQLKEASIAARDIVTRVFAWEEKGLRKVWKESSLKLKTILWTCIIILKREYNDTIRMIWKFEESRENL